MARGKHRRKAELRAAERTQAEVHALQQRIAEDRARTQALDEELAEIAELQHEVVELERELDALCAERVAALDGELADLRELVRMAEDQIRELDSDPVWKQLRDPNGNALTGMEKLMDLLGDETNAVITEGVRVGKKKKLTAEQIMAIQRARGLRK